MASSGPNYAATAADDSSNGGSAAWSTPTNAEGVPDSSTSGFSGNGGVISHYLKATNYGFSIPTGSTINGISVTLTGSRLSLALAAKDNAAYLVVGGSPSGSNKATGANAFSSSVTTITYGGSADTWGLTLTPSQVNASNFGFVFAVQASANAKNNSNSNVNAIGITVTYTAPSGQQKVQHLGMLMGVGC
jgi:hypothetical protein